MTSASNDVSCEVPLGISIVNTSLGAIPFSFLTVRTPLTTSAKCEYDFKIFVSSTFKVGQAAKLMVSPSLRSAKFCHNSSVINGMNGCMISKSVLKIDLVASSAGAEIRSPFAGLTISRYHEQKSSQTNL